MNSGYEYRERIRSEGAGTPLSAYLASRHAHSSEAVWRRRIAAGSVLVDGRPAAPGSLAESGRTLVWRRSPWEEPDAPLCFAVLWQDAHLLAVAKPAGLPTLPGANFLENTLLSVVRRHRPEAVPLHRLGRWTSGIVLFGLTRVARSNVGRAWREGRVLRRYRGLALGRPDSGRFVVSCPIGPRPHPRLGSVHAASPAGKPARTRVRVVERRDGCFLAGVSIVTGRPHQIRIHLAAAGHPLVGDPLYSSGGRPAPGCCALPGDPGYSLHATAIRVPHPVTSALVRIVCPPPPLLRRRTT